MSLIAKLFNVHVEPPEDPNDVEVTNLSVPPVGEPIAAAIVLQATQDDPLVIAAPGGIKSLQAAAPSVTTAQYRSDVVGTVYQIGNANPFRRRYVVRTSADGMWAVYASAEEATQPNVLTAGFVVSPYTADEFVTTAPLWAVKLNAADAPLSVAQEFYDGGYPS